MNISTDTKMFRVCRHCSKEVEIIDICAKDTSDDKIRKYFIARDGRMMQGNVCPDCRLGQIHRALRLRQPLTHVNMSIAIKAAHARRRAEEKEKRG